MLRRAKIPFLAFAELRSFSSTERLRLLGWAIGAIGNRVARDGGRFSRFTQRGGSLFCCHLGSLLLLLPIVQENGISWLPDISDWELSAATISPWTGDCGNFGYSVLAWDIQNKSKKRLLVTKIEFKSGRNFNLFFATDSFNRLPSTRTDRVDGGMK